MKIIKPIQKNKLSEMLSNINEQNIHKEIETGDPVGKEILKPLFCQIRSKALIERQER
jgi:hypothetical protein